MNNWKLSKKILFTLLTVLVLVLTVLSVVLNIHQKRVLTQELDKKGQNLAKFVADISAEPILSYNFTYLENYVKQISEGDKDIAYAVILGKDGGRLTHYAAEAQDKKSIREYTSPVMQDNDAIGSVKIGFSTSAIDSALAGSQIIIIGLSLTALCVIAVTVFLVFRATALKPIERLRAAVETIASGDLTAHADVGGSDELGELGEGINEMARSLTDLIGRIKTSSESIMSTSNRVSATSEDITSSVSRTAVTSKQAAENNESAASAVEETSATMHEMSANIQNVARNSQSQLSFVSETSSSIEQMVASIRSVAGQAERLLELSRETKKKIVLGFESFVKSSKSTQEISKAIAGSRDTITALGSRAEDIGKIVDVIDGIAEQTNLLALNAAIEAARAGEHGMGFAVVAEEVRKLADRSARSTREIGDLISGMQSEARQAVRDTQKTMEMVDRGVELSKQVNDALQAINNTAEEVDACAGAIGTATREQSSGSAQIAKAAENLRGITQEISAATEEQAAAAEQIVKTMEKIRGALHQNASGSLELAKAAEQLHSEGAEELALSVDQLRSEAGGFREIVGKFVLAGETGPERKPRFRDAGEAVSARVIPKLTEAA
jgi:methyl-accepting chemotaxis protein